jgi:hypothetical protein
MVKGNRSHGQRDDWRPRHWCSHGRVFTGMENTIPPSRRGGHLSATIFAVTTKR